jgi:uncharacterized membrane protein YhaH (DUF805 family)
VFEYLKGRSGRKEFWASIGLLLLVGIGLALLHVDGASAATTFLWIIVWSRRLHDIGKPGWYTLAPIGVMVLVVVAAFLFGGEALMDAMRYSEAGEGPVSDRGAYLFLGLVFVLLAIQAGFTIWLGMKAGDAVGNSFGPPPEKSTF